MAELINTIKRIIYTPKKFFHNTTKKEMGLKEPFLFLLKLSSFSTIMILIMIVLGNPGTKFLEMITGLPLNQQTNMALTLIIVVIFFGINLGLSFLWAGILHVWNLIFGGKGTYEQTYNLYVYAKTPVFLLSWIPLFGGFIFIYNFVLLIIGSMEIHKITRKKAIVMYLIPLILILVIMGLSFFMLFAFSKAMPMMPVTTTS
jgi:hypothetical protein